MAYLHCHSCEFSQDDFWHEGYNPVTCFQSDLKELMEGDLDKIIEMDSMWLKERNLDFITRRELILYHLDQIKSRIKNMKYRTMQEFKELNPKRLCPICGKDDLDID